MIFRYLPLHSERPGSGNDERVAHKHLDYIDLIKGVGIILVVLGHGPFPYHFMIDAFHMPLFFFLAGMTFHPPADIDRFIINKCRRLGVPYIFYGLTFGVASTLLGFPQGPLWFFETITLSIIFFMLLHRYVAGWKLGAVIVILALLALAISMQGAADILPFDMCRVLVAMSFIYCGFIYSKMSAAWQSRRKILYNLLLGLCAYGIGLALFRRYDVEGMSFMNGQIYNANFILFYATSIGGILLTVAFCQLIGKVNFINWLGKNSLTVMAAHWPLVQVLNIAVSGLAMFGTLPGKLLLATAEFTAIFLFCSACSLLFRRYIPALTGYVSRR